MQRRLIAAILGSFVSIGSWTASIAESIPPSWYTSGFDFSYSGTLGTTDIDFGVAWSSTPKPGYSVIPGLSPGQAWYAWMEADTSSVLALTSWTGYTPGPQGTQFLGKTKLDSNTDSSPLGPYPALVGNALADGTITVVICAIIDPNCAYENAPGSHLGVDFTFYIQLGPAVPSPETVPLPATLPLFVSGLGLIGLLGWRQKRKARLAGSNVRI
jgi:PEP-CTERM motif